MCLYNKKQILEVKMKWPANTMHTLNPTIKRVNITNKHISIISQYLEIMQFIVVCKNQFFPKLGQRQLR